MLRRWIARQRAGARDRRFLPAWQREVEEERFSFAALLITALVGIMAGVVLTIAWLKYHGAPIDDWVF